MWIQKRRDRCEFKKGDGEGGADALEEGRTNERRFRRRRGVICGVDGLEKSNPAPDERERQRERLE